MSSGNPIIHKRVRPLGKPPHFDRDNPEAHNRVRDGLIRQVGVIKQNVANPEVSPLPILAQGVFYPDNIRPP
jgi:hypothetical protein